MFVFIVSIYLCYKDRINCIYVTGIATAHKMNDLYLGHLTEVQTIKDESSKQMMCCLMDWKDCRAEEIIKGETEPTPKCKSP